jgi:polyhydroxyalkanoate synthase subunit PhaC
MGQLELLEREFKKVIIDGEEAVDLWVERARPPSSNSEAPLAVWRMYQDEGARGVPVILVHGFAQNRFSWHLSRRSFQGYLASRGFDVWNLELRGHGRSRELGSASAATFSEYVDDLCSVIACCEEPPFAIAHSMGAPVILGASVEMKLRGLVPIGGIYGFASKERLLRACTRLTVRLDPLLSAVPLSMNTKMFAPILTRNLAVADLWGFGLPIAGWSPGSVEFDLLNERIRQGFDWTSVAVWSQMSRWANGERLSFDKAFRESDTPLLVVLGDHDALLGVEDGMKCYEASGASDREAIVFNAYEHGRHWGHLDLILGRSAPQVTWPYIAAWLEARR